MGTSGQPAARRAGLLRGLYGLLTWLLVPALLLHLFWRGLSAPAYRQRILERFGGGEGSADGPTIWVHAVSVGEVQAAAPLIRALRDRYPAAQLLLTTMTPTGTERARVLFGTTVHHSYVPYDLAPAVRRFLDRWRPAAGVIMETELWPNLYHECGRLGVPLVLASARISGRSARSYGWLAPLFRDTLSHGVVIAAQTAADADRFLQLGASPDRVRVTGNIKFDVDPRPEVRERGELLRRNWSPVRPVWVAASTHEGEEAIVLAAHRQVLARHPAALLVLVPRHPERFAAVAALVRARGFPLVSRSSGAPVAPGTQVFLGDTMGELTTFYAAADLAFVGGSLVRIGGHNLLEPAALGLPVLTGPHNENAADIAAVLLEAGAAAIVTGVTGLAGAVADLLADPAERQRRGAAGQAALAANRGALDRLLALLGPVVEAALRSRSGGP